MKIMRIGFGVKIQLRDSYVFDGKRLPFLANYITKVMMLKVYQQKDWPSHSTIFPGVWQAIYLTDSTAMHLTKCLSIGFILYGKSCEAHCYLKRSYLTNFVVFLRTCSLHRPPYYGARFLSPVWVSSDYAQAVTGQVTEVTCPVIGWAQPELTRSKRQKSGPNLKNKVITMTLDKSYVCSP